MFVVWQRGTDSLLKTPFLLLLLLLLLSLNSALGREQELRRVDLLADAG